jgi:hypothetical protein
MEVSELIFNRITQLSNEQQKALLDKISFNLVADADEYCGKPINASSWNEPDLGEIREFFESSYDDPDSRLALYQDEMELTEQERTEFAEYIIEQARSNEYHPAIFTGLLTNGSRKLIVVVKRTGGGYDCKTEFLGIYKELNQAIIKLYGSDAEIV